MNKLSEEEILEGLKATDKSKRNKALSFLYQNYFPGIVDFIQKNSGTPEDAKDIFQDSLFAFYTKLINNELTLTTSVRTFLFSIAKNLWLKKIRQMKKDQKWKSRQKPTPEKLDSLELMIQNEQNDLIGFLLDELGENCRKVLILYYFEQLSMNEIKEKMGWQTVQSAKNKKSLCMKKLKKTIEENPQYRAILKKTK